MSTHSSEPSSDCGRDPAIAVRVEELYESHAALVRSVCGSLLRDRVETEDAVQQTFLSAQRALANGSSPRDAAAWLATIARNESLARVRSRMREPLPLETEAVGAGPDAHTTAVRHEELGGLRDALAGLPAQQRDAILLREVRGFSYEEVAASLSVTTPAVESLLFRARRTLQTRLREALAASSPVAWAQPLRELGARLVGSGLAVPTAAKVAAVGVSTAVVAGGAVVGTTAIGLGHAPARHAAPLRSHAAASAAAVSSPMIWTGPAPLPARLVDRRTAEGDASGHRSEASDVRSSSTASEQEGSGGAGGGTSESTSGTSSGSTGESGGGSTAEPTTSGGDSQAVASSGDTTTTGGDSTTTTTTTTTVSTSTDTGSSGSTDSGSGGSIGTASVSTSTDSGSPDSGD